MRQHSVLLVDDHTIFRQALRGLLQQQPHLKVVGEAKNGIDALRLAKMLKPDLALIDISLPELNGIDTCCRLQKESPKTRTIALSMFSDPEKVLQMLQAGALAYIVKGCEIEELLEGIASALEGEVYLPPSLSGVLVDEVRRSGRSLELTGRQREVLQLFSEGNSTKDIARKLKISPKTVETHRKQIMDKTGIDNLANLTKYAIREGLTDLES